MYLFYCMFFFVCSLFLSTISRQPAGRSRQILHAGVLWFQMCLLPFWGLAAPGAEKGGNEIVTIGVNGEFLHFGGF